MHTRGSFFLLLVFAEPINSELFILSLTRRAAASSDCHAIWLGQFYFSSLFGHESTSYCRADLSHWRLFRAGKIAPFYRKTSYAKGNHRIAVIATFDSCNSSRVSHARREWFPWFVSSIIIRGFGPLRKALFTVKPQAQGDEALRRLMTVILSGIASLGSEIRFVLPLVSFFACCPRPALQRAHKIGKSQSENLYRPKWLPWIGFLSAP